MSSKKAKRRKGFLEREKKRNEKREAMLKQQKALDGGNIEQMAMAMGIKLR